MQHHATLYIGSSLEAAALPASVRVSGNDIIHEVFPDLLTVADARRIAQSAARMPIESAERVLVIFANRIGNEAQNALLKLLEDPPGHTRFVLVVPTVTMLLPTVRSRLQLESTVNDVGVTTESGSAFLQATYKDRLGTIERLHKAKDRVTMRAMLTDIGNYVSQQSVSSECMRAATTALQYRDFSGASMKMWLEYLALLLPIVKDGEEVLH